MLEVWQQWAALSAFDDAGFREAAYGFFRKLAAELREHGKVRGDAAQAGSAQQHSPTGDGCVRRPCECAELSQA